MTYLTMEKRRVKGLTKQYSDMNRKPLVKPLPSLLRKKTKSKNGIGKIGAPVRIKNRSLHDPFDIGDRVSQLALAKRYLKKAGYTYKKRVTVY